MLYATTFEGHHLLGGMYPAYALLNTLLWIIQLLNIMWFYTICRVAYRGVIKGGVEDNRSETSSENESDDDYTEVSTSSETQKNK